MAMQWLSLGAIALITAAQAHAAEERSPAAGDQLDRVFVGVPTQLTLPPRRLGYEPRTLRCCR